MPYVKTHLLTLYHFYLISLLQIRPDPFILLLLLSLFSHQNLWKLNLYHFFIFVLTWFFYDRAFLSCLGFPTLLLRFFLFSGFCIPTRLRSFPLCVKIVYLKPFRKTQSWNLIEREWPNFLQIHRLIWPPVIRYLSLILLLHPFQILLIHFWWCIHHSWNLVLNLEKNLTLKSDYLILIVNPTVLHVYRLNWRVKSCEKVLILLHKWLKLLFSAIINDYFFNQLRKFHLIKSFWFLTTKNHH